MKHGWWGLEQLSRKVRIKRDISSGEYIGPEDVEFIGGNEMKERKSKVLEFTSKYIKEMARDDARRKELESRYKFQRNMNRLNTDLILLKEVDTKARLTDHEYLAKIFKAILSE